MKIEALEIIGFAAATATVAAFFCRDMAMLRGFAILANVLFLAYGIGLSLLPVAALHGALLPLNLVRLVETLRGGGRAGLAASSAEWGRRP